METIHEKVLLIMLCIRLIVVSVFIAFSRLSVALDPEVPPKGLPMSVYESMGLIPAPWKDGKPARMSDPQWQTDRLEQQFSAPATITYDLRHATQVGNTRIRIENVGDVNIVNPWLVYNNRRDWFDVDSMLAECLGDETDPKKRAFRIWRFLRDNRYHWYPAEGGVEVHSPMRFINVYGYGFCDDSATNAEALFKRAGFANARCWGLSGHVVPEVYYNGAWHMLDPDLKVFYPLYDNTTVASVEQCADDENLILRVHIYQNVAEIYTTKHNNSTYSNHWDISHTMAMTLRPGERLERCWYNWGKYHDNLYRQEPPVYGNGTHAYAPDLERNVFKSGFQTLTNIETFADSATSPNIHLLDPAQSGVIACVMETPYVYVGGSVELNAVLATSAAMLTAEFSRTGAAWSTLGVITGPFSGTRQYDLDALVDPMNTVACRKFWIRITLQGPEKTSVGIENLEIIGEIQCAPHALPTLRANTENQIEVRFQPVAGAGLQVSHDYQYRDYIPPPTAPPAPINPPDGGYVTTTSPRLEWEPSATSATITQREVMICWDEDGVLPITPPLWQQLTISPQWKITDGWLLEEETYYWRVRSRDSLGVWGPWGDSWSFTVVTPSYVPSWVIY